MSGGRLTAVLRRETIAGVRFTLRRFGDAHGPCRSTAGAAASCASGSMPSGAARAAPSVAVATPQSEGLVRVRTQVCFHTLPPFPRGRSRPIIPTREGGLSAAARRRMEIGRRVRVSTQLASRVLPVLPRVGARKDPCAGARPFRYAVANDDGKPSGHGPFCM